MPQSKAQQCVEQATTVDFAPAVAWLEKNAVSLPPAVADVLRMAVSISQHMPALKQAQAGAYRQLQRALGVIASSERDRPKKAGGGRDNLDPAERLQRDHSEALRLRDWHNRMKNKQAGRARRLAQKLSAMELEDIEVTPEEQAENARKEAACQKRLALGDGADAALAPVAETLMSGHTATLEQQTVVCPVEPEDLPRGACVQQSFREVRQRLDVSFVVTVMNVEVEKKSVTLPDGTVGMVCGEPETFGPAKMRVTWRFLANLVVLVSLYAMPLNRFARMVSSHFKTFTAAQLWRYYRFVAHHFAPIYNHLGVSLAQADVLQGDDTPSLVLEVSRHEQASPGTAPPWQAYATAAGACRPGQNSKPSLGHQLARVWGFVSPRKDGKGDKRALNTSVVCGRTVASDPCSTVVFYRSHLGGLGNLLDAILAHAPAGCHKVVQTDLATVNLLSPANLQRLHVSQAGCASHARRPFKLHHQVDPILCDAILHEFKGIPIYELSVDIAGRNAENTRAVRDVDQRALWQSIREYCQMLTQRWSRQTPLGEAARYVLRHYDKLTYYLTDARVPPTNNLSERLLRMEKLIANNALFRQTLEGRFALDIMRSILQTAVAAKVDLHAYLIWVLQMPRDAVAQDPAAFTPLAFKAWWGEQQAINETRDAVG